MKWPFMLRSTHERELKAAADHFARNLDRATDAQAAAEGAKRFAESRAQICLVRAEAAEAQLKQLAGPVLEVVQRTSALTIVDQAPAPGDKAVKVVACLTLRSDVLPAFADHSRVLGYAVQDLVHGAMQLVHQRDHEAAVRSSGPGGCS
jgi:hypothetical protein